MRKLMRRFSGGIPGRTIVYILAVWILLALMGFVFRNTGLCRDYPKWFPISIFRGPEIHLSGIPYLILFLALLALAAKYSARLNQFHVWLIALSLIILGNLGQGGWDSAFLKPFYESGIQYYHDAIGINSWSEWLESFNADQGDLLIHTRTHPPFAVLAHYLVLRISAGSINVLSIVFVLVSSLSVAFVWHIFRVLRVPLERRNLLAILFSVIPAVNIYTAVSLDGIILASATLFLLGMVIIMESESFSFCALLMIAAGAVITNLLTYAGVFLFSVAGILAVREFLLGRMFKVAAALLVSTVLFVAVALALYAEYGYNHIQSFLTAAALEGPGGLFGWNNPVAYLATRVECVSEIALLLSLGFLAFIFHPGKLGISYSDWRRAEIGMFQSGAATLLAMFLIGAFSTGETARAAMFIYPYIFLALVKADQSILKDIIRFAGLQTAAMQLFGHYFW